jgi:hypothetical protein
MIQILSVTRTTYIRLYAFGRMLPRNTSQRRQRPRAGHTAHDAVPLAYYFGWREFLRCKVQLLPFQNGKDSWLAAALINDVTRILASDRLGGAWAMLWGDEQRGIAQQTGQA